MPAKITDQKLREAIEAGALDERISLRTVANKVGLSVGTIHNLRRKRHVTQVRQGQSP